VQEITLAFVLGMEESRGVCKARSESIIIRSPKEHG